MRQLHEGIYRIQKDNDGSSAPEMVLPPSRLVAKALLTFDTPTSVVVPQNPSNSSTVMVAIFDYNTPTSQIWVDPFGTAAPAAAASFSFTTSRLRPPYLYLKSGTTLSVRSQEASATPISIAFYTVNGLMA